jgi:hypothetical protein
MSGRASTGLTASSKEFPQHLVRKLPISRPSRHQAWILAILALVLVFYVWTGASSFPVTFSGQGTGAGSGAAPGLSRNAYNLLATALMHGHLYLGIREDAAFRALAHPYQTGGAIEGLTYHDLAYYKGHFYSAWGPSPVLLFLAVRLITFGSLAMSQTLAVVLYCFLGLIGAVGLLHLLVRRLVPRTPDWLLVLATVGLALSSIAPYLLRRPAQYEVAISGAYAFEMLGLWLLAAALAGERRRALKLALASLLLGLAVVARPTEAAGALLLVLAVIVLLRRGGERRQILTCALAPFAVCMLVLGAYNALRFGSPANFGYTHQLALPPVDGRHVDDLAYLAPGLFGYVLMPPRLSLAFPYISLLQETQTIYPLTLPAQYAGGLGGWPLESAGGMIPSAPIVLMLLALPWLWRKPGRENRTPVLVAGAIAIAGVGALLAVTLGMWLTTERYETDFTSFFLIAAFLTWAVLLSRVSARIHLRRLVATVGVVLTAIGLCVGFAISFTGPFGLLQAAHPALFDSLEDTFAGLPTIVTKLAGHPMIASVTGPAVQTPTDLGPLSLQEANVTVTLYATEGTTVTVISPSTRRYFLVADAILAPNGKPGKNYSVLVSGTTAQNYAVKPPANGLMRIPVTLHSGINRVILTVAGPTPSPPFLLAGINITS